MEVLAFCNFTKYALPAPLNAVVTIVAYKYKYDISRQDFEDSKRHLLSTTIAVVAFVSSSKLKSQLGNQYGNAVALGSMFFPGALAKTIFFHTFVACVQGARQGGDKATIIQNSVMAILACVASSQGASDLYLKYFVNPLTALLK